MLLIWDIHINSKIKTDLLFTLREFVQAHSEEKNLIFLWDFVYHFSYDRSALLSLFEWFLELYAQGRSLYILAGNHDWLGNSFVFEEGKRVFDLLESSSSAGKLNFITEPMLTEIEGEKILFLPFCLDIDENKYPEYQLGSSLLTEALLQSKDKNEVFSGKINQLLNWYIKQEKKLTIIHHYYTNKQQFPWYLSSFSFKDIALSEQLLDNPDIKLISGHLHAPFGFKNYFCAGSVWATSPLEMNQVKGLWTWRDGQLWFFEQQVNSYFQIEQSRPVVAQDVEKIHEECLDFLKKQFENQNFFPLWTFEKQALNLKKTTLNLKVEQLNYDQVNSVIDDQLREQLADFRLKKSTKKVNDLLEKLETPDKDSLLTFGWWKELLRDFLNKQYPEEYAAYEKTLKELKIL